MSWAWRSRRTPSWTCWWPTKRTPATPASPRSCADMAQEMGEGKYYPELSARMAQFELTLLDWAEAAQGQPGSMWPLPTSAGPPSPSQFGFEPCYVNSRLAARGIPVACEVDIYGALSEYIGACVTGDAVTLLDINNSVPAVPVRRGHRRASSTTYSSRDTFMGFHCGNTPSCKLCGDRAVKYQLIQHRLLEPDGSDPDFTRGTLEGDIAPGDITFYRLQCDCRGQAPLLHRPGRGPARAHPLLRRHRRVRHPRDGPLLPPCADRRSAIPTMAQWPSAITARLCSSCSSCWASRISASTSPRACSTRPRIPSAKLTFTKKGPAIQSDGPF